LEHDGFVELVQIKLHAQPGIQLVGQGPLSCHVALLQLADHGSLQLLAKLQQAGGGWVGLGGVGAAVEPLLGL
jgi:hypothetical protein